MPFESPERPSFQDRVTGWVVSTFGKKNSEDLSERSHRFIEEAIELVQATGMTRRQVKMMVNYVYEREPGVIEQEVGGTMTTLAALSTAAEVDMDEAKEKELERVIRNTDKIIERNKTKPTYI